MNEHPLVFPPREAVHRDAHGVCAAASRPRWTIDEIEALFDLPLTDLLFRAQTVHRQHFDPNEIQLSTLLSIKTGGCSEDCGYCSQSARHDTNLASQPLMALDEVISAASQAKAAGATRFCMGAAWRGPKSKDLEAVTEMVLAVKALGLETCVTLGMLKEGQAERLKEAGLDYYNHNLDTAPEYYGNVVGSHTYADRLDTLKKVRDAGINVCCGGIVGMGEERRHRAGLIAQLANMDPQPESVPINQLVQIEGVPLHGAPSLDPFEFVRIVAVARLTMPKSYVRLSAGRQELGEGIQVLCFLAGANSIFYGDTLLTTENPEKSSDQALLARIGMKPQAATQAGGVARG